MLKFCLKLAFKCQIYKKIRKLLNNMSFYVIIMKNLGGNIE